MLRIINQHFSRARLAAAGVLRTRQRQERFLECLLIAVCIGLAALLHGVNGYKMVVLNLFYLPVVLSAFYLGRLRAGMLALFCVLMATMVAVLDLPSFAANTTPLITALSLTVWAAVMGLNAIIVGTLSDERSGKIADLRDANVGVVEVLAKYLKSTEPEMQDRSNRVATLSQSVARHMRLSDQEANEIRVAALLKDVNQIDVTAQAIHRAIGDLSQGHSAQRHTFRGSDLVESLGSALASALPLIVSHPGQLDTAEFNDDVVTVAVPFGTAIVDAVCQFDTLVHDPYEPLTAVQALDRMATSADGNFHPAVLHALHQVVRDLPARAADQLDTIEKLVHLEA